MLDGEAGQEPWEGQEKKCPIVCGAKDVPEKLVHDVAFAWCHCWGWGAEMLQPALFLSRDLSFSAGSTEWLELSRVPQRVGLQSPNEGGPGGRRVPACWLLFMA